MHSSESRSRSLVKREVVVLRAFSKERKMLGSWKTAIVSLWKREGCLAARERLSLCFYILSFPVVSSRQTREHGLAEHDLPRHASAALVKTSTSGRLSYVPTLLFGLCQRMLGA